MSLEDHGNHDGSPDDKKRAGLSSEGGPVKKRKQSTLNFAVMEPKKSEIKADDTKTPENGANEPFASEPEVVKEEPEVIEDKVEANGAQNETTEPSVKSETFSVENSITETAESVPDGTSTVEDVVEISAEKKSNGTAKAKPKVRVKAPTKPKAEPAKTKHVTLKFRNKITKTSIVRERNRITRTYPGPLVAVHYDLYDDNLFEAKENSTVAHERIAFGFDVKPSPHSADIIFILAFLAKFSKFIYVGHIGPQDIEYGLGLVKDPSNPEDSGVSRVMDDLFCKLLTLLLNRKKIITPGNYKSGVIELRQSYISLGLPKEWRDDTFTRVVTTVPTDIEADRVDPSKPPVLEEDNCEYSAPSEKLNPMHEKAFEDQGLAGIADPVDRLIMMRCLVLWSLSGSNVLKTHLAQVVNKQEIAGEKDTIYATRSILKGFTQTQELKKDLEAKINKKGKVTASPQGTPDPDASQRYIDPTSDPVVHPMALRLNEFIVGDCGFKVGRFYLVRMAEPSGGGISSVDRMKAVAKDPTKIKLSIPSRFKLYVEDVHAALLDSLRVHGPEFDKEGKEVPNNSTYDDSKNWYEVASNASELKAFISHLAQKLGLAAFGVEDISRLSQNSVAYKPTLYLYQYLSLVAPLIESFEQMEQSPGSGGSRTSRKKVDYNIENKLHNFEDGYDELGRDDGDDSYDEGEGFAEDDEEYSE